MNQTFEDRLLAELKDVVAAREPREPRLAPSRARRRLGLAAAVTAVTAVAAGVAIGVPVVLGGNGDRANAVERDPDGSIRIYIRDYQHPELIERRLASFNVRAVVNFLPAGVTCREPRATYAEESDNQNLFTSTPPEGDSNEIYTKLHPEQIKPGRTLVYTLWYDEQGDASMATAHFEQAVGPVGPCVRVPGGPGRIVRDGSGGVGR